MNPQPAIRFCPGCGTADPAWPEPKCLRCASCGFTLYLNAATAAAAIITCGDELLLTVRDRDPGKGLLDLAGGFLEPGETGEQGMLRELREELAFDPGEAALRYRFSYANAYPYRGVHYRTCDLFFHIPLTSKPAFAALDDVAAVRWIHRRDLDLKDVAFISIRQGLERFLAEG